MQRSIWHPAGHGHGRWTTCEAVGYVGSQSHAGDSHHCSRVCLGICAFGGSRNSIPSTKDRNLQACLRCASPPHWQVTYWWFRVKTLVYRPPMSYHSTGPCAAAHVARKCQAQQRQGQGQECVHSCHQQCAFAVEFGQRFSSRLVLMSPEAGHQRHNQNVQTSRRHN